MKKIYKKLLALEKNNQFIRGLLTPVGLLMFGAFCLIALTLGANVVWDKAHPTPFNENNGTRRAECCVA